MNKRQNKPMPNWINQGFAFGPNIGSLFFILPV